MYVCNEFATSNDGTGSIWGGAIAEAYGGSQFLLEVEIFFGIGLVIRLPVNIGCAQELLGTEALPRRILSYFPIADGTEFQRDTP